MVIVDDLEPVARTTTATIIAGRIRDGIMRGTFTPGTQLGEASLAQRLGVSRGPVREALQRLIQEGLLRSEPHRGVFVAVLDESDVTDIYRARRVIERTAVEAVVARPGEEREDVVRALDDLIAEMQEAVTGDRWDDVADADLRFHETIVAASNSKRLVRMFSTLLVETRMCVAALEPAYPLREDLVEEHRLLRDALADGDPGAVALVEAHLRDAVRALGGGG